MLTIAPSHRKWWIMVACCASLSMIFLDQSALPIALPSIQRELDLSPGSLQWVINAYLLVLAVLIILGGKLGDKLGHRRVFLCGMIIFITASLLCAQAPTGAWLIASRAMQGIGGAFMTPLAGPLLRNLVSTTEFNKMIGLYVSIASLFLILGPTLGGFFTAYLSWRWIFWINLPVALIAIFITIFIVPKDIKKAAGQEANFDWQGFVALSLCLICLVFALMEVHILGWGSTVILGCFMASLVAFIIFVRTEQHHLTPFVDLKIFKNSSISYCVLIITLIQIAYMGTIFWAMFLQYALSLSPQKTGICLLSSQIPVLFFSSVAGKMLNRFGPRLPVSIGTALICASSFWMAIFCWQQDFWWLFPALVVFGIGSPMVSISIMTTVVSVAPIEKRGVISGVISAARQVGGSLAVAVLAAVIIHATIYDTLQWLGGVSGVLSKLHPDQISALLIGTPLPVSLHLTTTQVETVKMAAVHAYTLGFSYAMLLVALLSLIGFFMAKKLPTVTLQELQPDNTRESSLE